MKYFKDKETGLPYAFEDDGSQDSFITENLVPMTGEEVDAHLNPPAAVFSRDQIDYLRKSAYADASNGSDRFFAEHLRHKCSGNTEKAESARIAGLARVKEIQKSYPWPK